MGGQYQEEQRQAEVGGRYEVRQPIDDGESPDQRLDDEQSHSGQAGPEDPWAVGGFLSG